MNKIDKSFISFALNHTIECVGKHFDGHIPKQVDRKDLLFNCAFMYMKGLYDGVNANENHDMLNKTN